MKWIFLVLGALLATIIVFGLVLLCLFAPSLEADAKYKAALREMEEEEREEKEGSDSNYSHSS